MKRATASHGRSAYFKRWIKALEDALVRSGVERASARKLAEETVIGIQGALTLSRALDDTAVFGRTVQRLKERTNGCP